MSENTSCNYCNLRAIKERAKKEGKIVTMVGNECFVHPKSVKIMLLAKKRRSRFFAAWFEEIPQSCCC